MEYLFLALVACGLAFLVGRYSKEPLLYPSVRDEKACNNCKHSSSAWAGEYWDRCHHPEVAHLTQVTRTGPGGSSASLPRCMEMRRWGNHCGKTGKLFEQVQPGDPIPRYEFRKDLHAKEDIPVIPVHEPDGDDRIH